MRVGTEAEVLDGLTGVLWSTEKEGVGTSWGAHGKLVNGEALAAGLDNPRTGGSGEAQSSDGELGNLQETVVVGNSCDQDNSLSLVSLRGVLVGGSGNQAGKRHRWAVDLAHHQSAEDGLIELGVGSAGEESIELDKKGDIWVVRLGGLAVAALNVMEVW